MAPNSLSPASVVIDYHSAYGAHKMTIPTRAWNPVPLTGTLGSYIAWNSVVRDGEAMINDLVDLLVPFVPATFSFDKATTYLQASAGAPNIPQTSVALTQVGTSGSTNPSAAVSATFLFKTTGNGIFKLVLLDSPFGSGWLAPLLPGGFSADANALENEVIDPANAWSGRDDLQPAFMNKITYDVNDKLQKMYFR
jgi:hypothetical protein